MSGEPIISIGVKAPSVEWIEEMRVDKSRLIGSGAFFCYLSIQLISPLGVRVRTNLFLNFEKEESSSRRIDTYNLTVSNPDPRSSEIRHLNCNRFSEALWVRSSLGSKIYDDVHRFWEEARVLALAENSQQDVDCSDMMVCLQMANQEPTRALITGAGDMIRLEDVDSLPPLHPTVRLNAMNGLKDTILKIGNFSQQAKGNIGWRDEENLHRTAKEILDREGWGR